MKQWYCIIGGQQYGPVSEDELRQWVAEGRVRPTDQVWTDGMATWAPAGSVEGLFAPGTAVPPPAGLLVACPAPGGTGGQTPNAHLTAQARGLLRGKWGLPIGFSLLLGLLAMAANSVGGGIAVLILGGALELGGVIFYLTFVRGGNCELGMLFAGFKVFGKALGAYMLRFVFVLLWMLPGIVVLIIAAIGFVVAAEQHDDVITALAFVGVIVAYIAMLTLAIIASLIYSQMFYLMCDDSALGPMEALRTSKQMMQGYKGKLFCLGMRFFGWAMLCLLAGVVTCGIGAVVGFLFLAPYASASYARFYDDLRPPAAPAAAAQLPGSPQAGSLISDRDGEHPEVNI